MSRINSVVESFKKIVGERFSFVVFNVRVELNDLFPDTLLNADWFNSFVLEQTIRTLFNSFSWFRRTGCIWFLKIKDVSFPSTLVPVVVLMFEDTEVSFPGDKMLNLGLILLNRIFSDALIYLPPPINSLVNETCG